MLLTSGAAVIALGACNSHQVNPAPVANDAVKITQGAPPAGGTWVDVINATSAGYMIGNPRAKVKLVEVGSLSCPHCRMFEEEGTPILLGKYVKSGEVSFEFRPYVIHGPIDMAADIVARCNGLKTFFPIVAALYKDQDSWLGRLQSTSQDRLNQIQSLPANQMFVAIADILKLQDWVALRGVPRAKTNQCLADQGMIDHEVEATSEVNNRFPEFEGTPAFVINGTMLKGTASWDELQPQLDAALK
jgi:protein-disulfide isomerase